MSVQPARSREVAVTFLRSLEAEPWRFDYFTVLRHLERTYKDSPRISDSAARREEYVQFGQDPYMEFPASNLARAVQGDNQPLKLFVALHRTGKVGGRKLHVRVLPELN